MFTNIDFVKGDRQMKILYYFITHFKKVKALLLFLYLKSIGRLFSYILARKHPNNEQIYLLDLWQKNLKER